MKEHTVKVTFASGLKMICTVAKITDLNNYMGNGQVIKAVYLD